MNEPSATAPARPDDHEVRIDISVGTYRGSFLLYVPHRLSWRLCRMLLLEQITLELRNHLDKALQAVGIEKRAAGRTRPW